MARDPQDLASLSNILLAEANQKHQELPTDRILSGTFWESVSIGVLNSEWGTDPTANWKWGSAEVVRPEQKLLLGSIVLVLG
jgi:hypothetical protein